MVNFNKYPISDNIKETLDRYIINKIEPGSFLRAVLENDLYTALANADLENKYAIYNICNYIVNTLPTNCYGSLEIVKNWLRKK
jgi:hypothetical protein